MRKKRTRKINLGPLTVMILLSAIIAVISFIGSKLGLSGVLTDQETLETTTITVNNIFSKEGIQYVIGSALRNFRGVEPLVAVIVSLITVSILEVSGLLRHLFGGLKNVKSSIITFVVLFISICSTFVGDYSYAILLPFVAAIYRIMGRDAKTGIMTSFIGITMGYGTGLVYNYQDVLLGNMTEVVARNVLDNYSFFPWSTLFMMLASTIILTIVGTIMIEKTFPKKVRYEEEEELVTSRPALRAAIVAFIVMALVTVWSIIPGLPLSGWMLDESAKSYMAKLMGENAPFKDGFMVILLGMALICSYIYGKVSRNIKGSGEFNKAISKTFQNTGFIFAGLFFASIMLSVLEFTNLNTVLSLKLLEVLRISEMSGVFIVGATLIVCIIITILNPSTISNWRISSPIVIDSLVRANISPEFGQMIFKAGDSIGKCFSPFYIFFIIMLGFLYKADSQDEDISFFGTVRKMCPVLIVLALTWLVIIVGWNLIGISIGMGSTTTL